VAHDVLRHRVMLSYEANAEVLTSDQVLDKVLALVAVA
jgi:MoxR-like ATPase